jgi:hypothetical protein
MGCRTGQGRRIWVRRLMPAVGWFWCAGVVVVGAGALFDVGGGFGMFFAVQGDRVRHLTLLIAIDGGLHIRFESSTCCESWTVLQSWHCLRRLGGDVGWW